MNVFTTNLQDIKKIIHSLYLIHFGIILLIFIVFYNFIILPKIVISFSSNTSGESQLFYKPYNENYSEQFSKIKSLKYGKQTLTYSLPYYHDKLRWDPSNTSFNIEISQIDISIVGIKFPLKLESISAYNQIESIIKKNKILIVKSIDNANDPQIFLTLDTKEIEYYRVVLSIIATFIVLISLGIPFIYRNKIINFEREINNHLKDIDVNSFYLKQLFILTSMGIFLHIFEISSFMISIDDEYSAFRTNPEAWIADGRWTGYIIERFIFSQPTMPYIPNLISCFFMALSFILIIKSHNLLFNWKSYITYPIFAAFPTLWFINEFYGNMVMVAIGFFMTSLSIYLFSKVNESNSGIKLFFIVKFIFIPAIFLAVAIGSYQSFIMLFISMGIGVIIVKDILCNKNKTGETLLSLLILSAVLIMGLLFYSVINYFFKFLFAISGKAYIEHFLHLNELLSSPLEILAKVIHKMFNFYSGSADIYGISIFALGLFFLFSTSIILLKKVNTSKFILIPIWIIFLFAPFLLHFITGVDSLPTRSMVAMPYVSWLMGIILLTINSRFKLFFALIIIILAEIQILSASGQYAAATNLTEAHDRMLADDLYSRISASNSEFDKSKISVIDVFGWHDFKTIYPLVPHSTMGASFFNWDQGNISRMVAYMNLLGYDNLQALDRAKRKDFIKEFEKMPIWPAKDSVKFIDNVYLIKLGHTPDISHKENK